MIYRMLRSCFDLWWLLLFWGLALSFFLMGVWSLLAFCFACARSAYNC